MTFGKRTLLLAGFAAFFMTAATGQALAKYTYIHNEGEYSVELPDAPKGETIWADQKNEIPYIENPPKFGALGEYAYLYRVDADTGDFFKVDITFLKSGADFLAGTTEEKLMEYLGKEFKGRRMENLKSTYSAGSKTLKWASMTGFTVDEKNNLLYRAVHFLTGLETILIIKSEYTAENKNYSEMYQRMAQSIKFTGK